MMGGWRVFINADQDMTLKDFLFLTIDHTPIDTTVLHVNGRDMDKFLRAYAKLKISVMKKSKSVCL